MYSLKSENDNFLTRQEPEVCSWYRWKKVSGRKKKVDAKEEVWHLPQERSVPDDVFTEHFTTAKSHLPLSLLKPHFSTAQ